MKTRLRLCHLAAPVDMIQTTLCICGDGYDPAKPSAQPSPAQSSDSSSRLLLQLRPPALPPAPQLLSAETAWPAHLAVQPASPLPSPAFENCPSSLPGLVTASAHGHGPGRSSQRLFAEIYLLQKDIHVQSRVC